MAETTKTAKSNGVDKNTEHSLCQKMLDYAPEPIFIADQESKVIFYNKAANKLFNYSQKEALGLPINMLIDQTVNPSEDLQVANNNTKQRKNGTPIPSNGIGSAVDIIKKGGFKSKGYLIVTNVKEGAETYNMHTFKDVPNHSSDELKSAIDTGWASIEFQPDGIIITANDNFTSTLEYSGTEEVVGKHHRMFCDAEYANSAEYQNFWSDLANGQVQSGEFKRFTKTGKEIWINASYTPIKDLNGQVIKVIKIATDITSMVDARIKADAVTSAVNTGWASIEFQPDGTIINANSNFVSTLGYASANDIIGQHHSIFCESVYAQSTEYKSFWKNLANGDVQAGEFKRLTKAGNDVWINASYTPIKNAEGHVFKVIKIASNITNMVETRIQADAIKSAVDTGWASIEFEPNGTIINANNNFVSTLGFSSANDIVGQHHSLFCDVEYTKSKEYTDFWNELANGKVKAGEFMRVRKDGTNVWINASYTPVKDESGKVVKVIKIAADISAQKQVIQAIQEVVRIANEEGDLSARVELEGATGDYKILQDSVNGLLDTIGLPIQRFKELVIELSKGNLDIEFELDVQGDMKEMGDAMNLALSTLNSLMGSIMELANLVASASEEMLSKGEQMKGSTGEMSSAIQQMAEGVQDQAQQIDTISKIIDDVLRTSQEMGSKSQIINKAAEEGRKSSKAGANTITSVVDSMEGIQASATVTSNSIEVLTERSEEIARTLNVITDIAAQTNLLALNAAIEAARAGEAGRGFAVVAEEIRKLAEDSRTSAQEIEKVINEVQKDISSAGKSIQEMDGSVKSGNKASAEADEVFKAIDSSSEQTFSLSDEILEATKLQEDAINNTVKNVEKIVVVSEETASGTEQVAASSKELSQGMDEVSASSQDLADIANQLLEGVSKFNLKPLKNEK